MKTNSILKTIFSLLLLAFTISSCVKDDDFDTPTVACNDDAYSAIPQNQMTTFQNVLNTYVNNSISDFVDEDGSPIYIEGYVTSNDLEGNFYKELFIQDSPNNPTYAVKLGIDVRSLYTKYPMGSKIMVKLNGLAIDQSHGEMIIGENRNGQIDEMRENIALSHILRSCEINTITPLLITSSSEINNDMLGKYIQLTDAQFHVGVLGLPFVDPNDNFDSHKEVVFCSDNSSIKIETSSFASYGQSVLPEQKINISGILSRDYGDNFYVLKLNSPNTAIEILDDPRCDPLFIEDFSNGLTNWTAYNVDGNQVWEVDDYNGISGNYAKMSGYNNGSQNNEDWLITPAIDLSDAVNPSLSFITARNYSGPDLQVFLADDYTSGENPNTSGTWTEVSVTLSSGSWNWEGSGNVDLADYIGGNVYIAFKYLSTTSGSATYELDNITIEEN